MVNKNKKDLRWNNCYLSQISNDEGALAIMCEKYEEPQLATGARWKIVMAYACYRAMETHYQ
jgi:hypothetical protein